MREPKRLNPEDSLQITFKETLDLMQPKCLYFHIPNEGKRSWPQGKKMKSMGLVAGAPDWIFIWNKSGCNGGWAICGFLEMKSLTGVLSDPQMKFRETALRTGCHYVVTRSVEHAIDVLKSWGIKFERELK